MNGSFEDENICTEYLKNCAPEGWMVTTTAGNYYFDDAEFAQDKEHFVGLLAGNATKRNIRTYLRSRLLCGLRNGHQYKVEFYIRSYQNILDSIGVYFSDKEILYQKDLIKKSPAFFIKQDSAFNAANYLDWQKVSINFTATGNEIFFAIGNFKKLDFSNIGKSKNAFLDINFKEDLYFFIDNITLQPLNSNEKLCNDAVAIKDEEYEVNERHHYLDKKMYVYGKNPPKVPPLPKTVIQKIDTLIIPDVLFATNSYALNNKATAVLDSFINYGRSKQVDSIIIEGHTDNRGSVELNNKLSIDRAMSVNNYMHTYFNTETKINGYGIAKPIADNTTPVGRQKNRRVEIYLYTSEK